MNHIKCHHCGSEMREHPVDKYHYIESGLKDIFLRGIIRHECPECRESYMSIPKVTALHRLIGRSLCCKKAKLTGCEIKFLRKELSLRSKEFAKTLGITHSHMSRLENNEKITSTPLDKLIRTVYMLSLKEANVIFLNPAESLSMVAIKTDTQKDQHLDLTPQDWLTERNEYACHA